MLGRTNEFETHYLLLFFIHFKEYPEALRAGPPPRFVEPDDRILRSPRGPLGALGVLWGVRRPRVDQGSPREAPGGLGAVSGASLGSPKSLLLGGEYVIKINVLRLGRFLMK